MARIIPLVLVVCMATVIAGSRYPSNRIGSSNNYPRPSRGFKNTQLSTARGFGKRDSSPPLADSAPLSSLLDPRR